MTVATISLIMSSSGILSSHVLHLVSYVSYYVTRPPCTKISHSLPISKLKQVLFSTVS